MQELKNLLRSIGSTDLPSQLYELIKLAPSLLLLTESGLYGLLFRSDKGPCVKFRIWVTNEVLPSIRKTGRYQQNVEAAKMELEFAASVRLAKQFGLEGNQAILAANRFMKNLYGQNCMALLETSLETEQQELYVTATDLGAKQTPPLSANVVNKKLEALKLQMSHRDSKGRLVWELTNEGKKNGKYFDTGKKHSDGTPVQQVKWRSSLPL